MVLNSDYIVLVVRISVPQVGHNIQFYCCLVLELVNTSNYFYSNKLPSLMIKTFKRLTE